MNTEGRCYIKGGQPIPLRKGVVHFPEIVSRGGEADVEKAGFRPAAVLGIRGTGDALPYHKSVLTVRLEPERSTVS